METYQAIKARKSIRKFKDDPISEDVLKKILYAGTLAPSGKNKQPWKFYIVQGDMRQQMAHEMENGIARLEAMGIPTGSAKHSLKIMKQAPATVFVFNPTGKHPLSDRDTLESYTDVVDIQSVGAAIQNMCLAAVDMKLGSLWICDVFFAYEELCAWLNAQGQLIAALSLGVPDIDPQPRPRKPVEDVTEFLS